jgi:hypothetical protein
LLFAFTGTTQLPWACCVEFNGHLQEDRTMHPADFADPDTLTCTLAAMLYKALQRSHDPAITKALNECGLVLPWEQRSAAVRNVWETAVRQALENMAIIGDTAHELRIYHRPAALDLQDNEAVIQ